LIGYISCASTSMLIDSKLFSYSKVKDLIYLSRLILPISTMKLKKLRLL
jgi:hypothetical protein